MTRRASPEAAIQVKVMRALNQSPRKLFAFAVPNGGNRSTTEAIRLKQEGVKAGVPDICIITDGHSYHLELKAEKGRVSDQQLMVLRQLQDAGATVAVAHGLEGALDTLRKWELIP